MIGIPKSQRIKITICGEKKQKKGFTTHARQGGVLLNKDYGRIFRHWHPIIFRELKPAQETSMPPTDDFIII